MTRRQPSVVVFDNYDSFTFNLVHYLEELGATVTVIRADQLGASDALGLGADGFLISPGPGSPGEAGNSKALVAACAAARLPLLGVCLGHQCIGEVFGATVERAHTVMHGKMSRVSNDGSGLFRGLPSRFTVTRYHSLAIDASTLPDDIICNALAEDQTVQGIRHRDLQIHGVQFHPESIASECGHALLRNFVELMRVPADMILEALPG